MERKKLLESRMIMNKVLLFTHEQDIDGMGSILIGKQAFKQLDYITCKTFEVNEKVSKTIHDGSIYHYDFIFVTDICIKEPLLLKISKDSKLNQKIIILDHHKTEIEEGNNQYPFVHIIVENEQGKTSGTSLFYDYLITHKLLTKTPYIEELTELTRQYDTWEWKTKYNNPKARMLHILFEQLGYKQYLETMNQIITTKQKIEFNSKELELIKSFDEKLTKTCNNIIKEMVIYNLIIENKIYKIGFIWIPYQYRNEFDEIIRKNNVHDIDAIGMIMTDKDTVSYRKVKDIDVSIIGKYFGGKGHKNAASNPQNNEHFQKILKTLKQEMR